MYRLLAKQIDGRWVILGDLPSKIELQRMARTTYAHMQTKIVYVR